MSSAARAKGITFSRAMLRAIEDGRKTQTRRMCSEYVNGHPHAWDSVLSYKTKASAKGKLGATFWSKPGGVKPDAIHVCPQVAPYASGDLLYVREAFRTRQKYDHLKPSELPADAPIWYEANIDTAPFVVDWGRYRHARFMPRRFARLWLAVTNVRVERLGQISEEDAEAEGIAYASRTEPTDPCWNDSVGRYWDSPRDAFKSLWESLYGPGSWERDKDKWVWVVEFQRAEAPESEDQ